MSQVLITISLKRITAMSESSSYHQHYYIIVGTGSSDAVMTKTLTDDKNTSVLILKAGDNNNHNRPIQDSSFAAELEGEKTSQNIFGKVKVYLRQEWTKELLNERTGFPKGGLLSMENSMYDLPRWS